MIRSLRMSAPDKEMAARVTRLQPFVQGLEFILSTFTSSSSKFHRVATLDANATWPGLSSSKSASAPQLPHIRRNRHSQDRHRPNETLVVLDASFNPPSKAHAALALAAVSRHKHGARKEIPCRILLLLGTRNADKHADVPATHAQRLAMLILFATDLRDSLAQTYQAPQASVEDEDEDEEAEQQDTPIDIGLASIPYMADKAAAIENEQPPTYASETKQVHVMGYDTIIRVLAPRYYVNDFDPPLSGLEPLFGRRHDALVVLRPTKSGGSEEQSHVSELEKQRAEVHDMISGKLKADGFKDVWRSLVNVMECKEAADVSSTAIRAAAEKHDYHVVQKMCTPSVAAWIRDQALYSKTEVKECGS